MSSNIIWKDIDLSLEKQTNGDIKENINENAIAGSLFNIIFTHKGERRMLPLFALDLDNYIFEQIDTPTAYSLANEILNVTRLWDKRINIIDLLVKPMEDEGRYDVQITYTTSSSTIENTYRTTIYAS